MIQKHVYLFYISTWLYVICCSKLLNNIPFVRKQWQSEMSHPILNDVACLTLLLLHCYLSLVLATVPKIPTRSAPPSSTVVLMSGWPTAHPRLPSPPLIPRSPSWQTSARARCLTWLMMRLLWMTPAQMLALKRALTSSVMARTPSMTAHPGSSWWEGWWLAVAFARPPHIGWDWSLGVWLGLV